MKEEPPTNVSNSELTGTGTVYIRINIPELKIQKCLQFQLDETVWIAKQRVVATFAKDLKDGLNYGLYCPPTNGRAGKFLDEERLLREYPLQGPIGFLEFKYKRRVYKLLQINQRKIKQLHTKAVLKQFLDHVRHGQTDKVSKLVAKGLDPNYHDPDTGETPLTIAVLGDKCREMIITLVSGGTHLDFRNRLGLTALHKAALRGNSQSVKALLDLGASPNYKDGRGLTPLYYSVINDSNTACTEMLLHERALVGTTDEQGWGELHHSCRNGRVQHTELLVFYGTDMDIQNASGNTPLHICAVNNQESCARVLLFRGAQKDILNYNNQTPAQAAILAGHTDLAAIIQRHRPEDVVAFRELPSYNTKRKFGTITPSMRAMIRSRSAPRMSIMSWEMANGGNLDSSGISIQDESMSENSWKGYNSDSPRLSVSSTTSSSPVISESPTNLFDRGSQIIRDTIPVPGSLQELKVMRRASSAGEMDRNTLAALLRGYRENHTRTVTLQKSKDGYGFVLRGAKSQQALDFQPTPEYPALQYLDSIDKGSISDRAGLKSGDFILEINCNNVVRATHDRVVDLIRNSGKSLQLKVTTVGETTPPPPQLESWFAHEDGSRTLPSRGKKMAPAPPKRSPGTSLSYSKAKSRSYAEGIAEIEKLDETLAQFDESPAMHPLSSASVNNIDKLNPEMKVASIRARTAAKRVSHVHLEDIDFDSPETKPPALPNKKFSPSEQRIQKYHKKQLLGNGVEKSRSPPSLVNSDVIYATPISHDAYKTVVNVKVKDSDTSSNKSDTSSLSSHGSHGRSKMSSKSAILGREVKPRPPGGFGTTGKLQQKSSPPLPPAMIKIPPPPRQAAPVPPVKSEMVQINTATASSSQTVYANVSADIQARKEAEKESEFGSSFRPASKLIDDTTGDQQQRLAQMSEKKQKYSSYPRITSASQMAQQNTLEHMKHDKHSVSFAEDRVYEKAAVYVQQHPNASLLVTKDTNKADDGPEPEPDYDSDGGDTIHKLRPSLPGAFHAAAPVVSSRRSSSSSTASEDAPWHGNSKVTSIETTHVSVTAQNQAEVSASSLKAEASPSTVGSGLSEQIRLAAEARERRTESRMITSTPPPPPPPPPSSSAPLAKRVSGSDIQNAVALRQARIDNGQSQTITVAETAPRAPMDPTQTAILEAVAKRRTMLEQKSDTDVLERIESKLNKGRKLQSAKFFTSQNLYKSDASDSSSSTTSQNSKVSTLQDSNNNKSLIKVVPASESAATKSKSLPLVKNKPLIESTVMNNVVILDKPKPVTGKDSSSNVTDFLALAEKTRQEWLKKKGSGGSQSSNDLNTSKSSSTSSSSSTSDHKPVIVSNKTGNNNNKAKVVVTNGQSDDGLSFKDKVKTLEKKFNGSVPRQNGSTSQTVRVGGVTMDHSQTDNDYSSLVKGNAEVIYDLPPPPPPPGFDDSGAGNTVRLQIIPPPTDFAGSRGEQRQSSAFGHDDSASLHSSVSTLSTLSSEHGEVQTLDNAYEEMIVPPPPAQFDDLPTQNVNNNKTDNLNKSKFIAPPPAFQSINNSAKSHNGNSSDSSSSGQSRSTSKAFQCKSVEDWLCVDVQDWLESLKLAQYKARFAQNTIDGRKLMKLSRNDYIDLGVEQVGHRMNMERSIKKLALRKSAVF